MSLSSGFVKSVENINIHQILLQNYNGGESRKKVDPQKVKGHNNVLRVPEFPDYSDRTDCDNYVPWWTANMERTPEEREDRSEDPDQRLPGCC